MAPALDIDTLPHPGSRHFLPSLLAHVHAALPGLPLEPTIVQVLLLCVVSGDRNLILRTREEDIGLVARLTTLVSSSGRLPCSRCQPLPCCDSCLKLQILSSLFGYTVHKLRCHTDTANQTPFQFLLSLFFLPQGDSSLGSSQRPRDRTRRTSSPRNRGGKPLGVTSAPTIAAHTRKSSLSQSASCASDSRPSTATSRLGFEEQATSDVGQTAPVAYSRFTGVHSSKSHQRNFSRSSAETLSLPNAVVVSGLEHASLSAQKAVLRTLADRKLVLPTEQAVSHAVQRTFDLPENFILVYVCRLDPRERPFIYKSLVRPQLFSNPPSVVKLSLGQLDRFAMSSPVNVSQQTRLVLRQYRSPPMATPAHSPPRTPGTASTSAPFPLTPPAVLPVTPVIAPSLLGHLKTLCADHIFIQPSIGIYLADLFTATRHLGCVDGTLLTVRAKQDAEALIRASRVLGVDPTGAELVKEAAGDFPPLTGSDTSSTERGHPGPPATTSTPSDDVGRASLISSTPRSLDSTFVQEDPLELDVSEADVARIFPRVVSHRLRVRDSPFDEPLSSLVCGAVGRSTGTGEEGPVWERQTVKDALIHVLSEV